MLTTKVLIKFPTHLAHIQVNETSIHIFKYNDRTCDFMVFDHSEQLAAGDYIVEDLPRVYYYVTVND